MPPSRDEGDSDFMYLCLCRYSSVRKLFEAYAKKRKTIDTNTRSRYFSRRMYVKNTADARFIIIN